MPTPTLEEYLEAIYKLSQEGAVRPTRIAEVIGVSGPTVTVTLRRMEAKGLVTRAGTAVVLTDQGMTAALDIVRRHRIAERFLTDTLGLDWEAAHEDACVLEHALTPRVLEALERFLENPEVCPHGHPIPSADGTVVAPVGVPLSGLAAGESAFVTRVSEGDEILGYLGELGLRPGVKVRVVGVAPFDGPLTIEVGGRVAPVSRDIASKVSVTASRG